MSFDPELMQDFLTESGELLDQLDHDLVTLESTPQDLELVNRIFRALHTIKGSASFLTLTNLVSVAHAAETALNDARNRVYVIDRAAMDLLLAAVDTIKKQFDNIRAGEELISPDAALCEKLIALGAKPGATSAHAHHSATPVLVGAGASSGHASVPAFASGDPFTLPEAQSQPFTLPPNKADLVEFLAADVEATLDQIQQQLSRLGQDSMRSSAASTITDLADALVRSVDFFGVEPMTRLATLLKQIGAKGADLPKQAADTVGSQAGKAVEMLRETSKGLVSGQLVQRPLDTYCHAIESLLTDEGLDMPALNPPAQPATDAPPPAGEPIHHEPADVHASPAAAAGKAEPDHADKKHAAQAAEQTIRVEVSRLETLLNLVGELVLQKNRVAALGRQMTAANWGTQEYREVVTQTNSALDRVTSDLQVAVMKTRMQPLEKLFGKYPRLIRDLARKLNKNINLVIEGGETEVDKSVIEELGDPLIHLMRNSCDHGIEMPEARKAAGKSETGTIKLIASHEGSHVQILIVDDGKGIDPAFISRKAIDKGIVTEQQVAAMSDREKVALIFAPGFSTAEKISDVSGRGVGMDVVRTNIEKLKGTVEIESVAGQGTTMRVKIPLTVAIMAAMMVAVGQEIYAVPLASITEIVKPEQGAVSTIRGRKVMRLRDTVLPLVDAAELFNLPSPESSERPFAVVLSSSGKRVGLMVTRPVGQQEVVIKPLDEHIDKGGPVSGATVRDDGGVSLIVDIGRLFAIAEKRASSAP